MGSEVGGTARNGHSLGAECRGQQGVSGGRRTIVGGSGGRGQKFQKQKPNWAVPPKTTGKEEKKGRSIPKKQKGNHQAAFSEKVTRVPRVEKGYALHPCTVPGYIFFSV